MISKHYQPLASTATSIQNDVLPPFFFWELSLISLNLSLSLSFSLLKQSSLNFLYGDTLCKKTRTFHDSTRL